MKILKPGRALSYGLKEFAHLEEIFIQNNFGKSK
jgi:hypothetical protein